MQGHLGTSNEGHGQWYTISRPWWEYWMTEHTEPFALIDVVLSVFIYIVSFPHLVVLMCQISYHVFFFWGGGITKVL